MSILIVVDNPDRWPLQIPGVATVAARDYLTEAAYTESRGITVFNLCRSYAYQSIGYYVSLLGEARGHRPKPSIATIQDMKMQAVVRVVNDDVRAELQRALAPIQSDEFELSIYFGRPLAKRYERLSQALFNAFQGPLLRARFAKHGGVWVLDRIGPISAKEIPDSHHSAVIESAQRYFANRRFTSKPKQQQQTRYDLAILVDPEEPNPPSNKAALDLFERVAGERGVGVERIGKDDFGRIAEFDALFVRATTSVNHYTYRFARAAAAAGLAVIDDPQSIVRCANKVYLAELMNRYHVRAPRTMIVHEGNVDQVAGTLGLPCVLKAPDSAFSKGVVRVDSPESLQSELRRLLDDTELAIAQEYLPTEYDWRVGVLDGKPLFVCRYFMAPKHWQIYKHQEGGDYDVGKVETLSVDAAPRQVVRTAVKVANLIGDGLYGVDLKQSGRKLYLIEVNDNPNIDHGYEDRVLGRALYELVIQSFITRIERNKSVGAVK